MNRILLVLLAVVGLAACSGDDNPAGPSSLVIEDLVAGTGAAATVGDVLTVHYRGTLTDGRVFDSSYSRGTPFSFRLGAGNVIAGWDQGLVGMRVGGRRRLTIPPELGYGRSGSGPIPGNATLVFEVELLAITR